MRHLNINISKYEIAGVEILSGISEIVNDDDRIAVVGGNGAGKTTFMKIVTEEITGYEGKIDNTGGITLGYLAQIHFDHEEITVREELRNAFAYILEAEARLDRAEKNMDAPGGLEEYSEALERFQMIGGYDFEREIDRVGRGIGVFDLLDRKVSEISGGQRTKVALAKMLLLRPNFLMLDEPTNFIDLQSAEWLENYLQETWKGGYMIISHDREFLDATCNKVFEITPNHTLEVFHGNYSYYVAEKKRREEKAIEEYERHIEFVKSEKALINRFRAGSRASFAKSRENQLERIEEVKAPIIPARPNFLFNFSERPSEKILDFKECFVGRKEPLFFINEIILRNHDRVGIVGENGVGKSTLLKTILGQLELLDGYFSKGK